MDNLRKIQSTEKKMAQSLRQDFLHIHNLYQLTESDLFDTAAIIIDITK